jgi:RHS repeat-associated protein
VDSTGTKTYKRDGAYVTDPVLSDSAASYTPGISERRSSTTKFYHTDRLGTTERLTNTSQTTTDTRTYDAFGLLVSSSGSTPTPFGFAGAWGYQEDPDSGLKLLGHRYYDPSTGRFLTRDPLADGRNWYVYSGNNSFKYVDPSGLFSEAIKRIVAGFAIIIGGYWEYVKSFPMILPKPSPSVISPSKPPIGEGSMPGSRSGPPKPGPQSPAPGPRGQPETGLGGGPPPGAPGGPGAGGGILGWLLKPALVIALILLPANSNAPSCAGMIHGYGKCPSCGAYYPPPKRQSHSDKNPIKPG